MKSAIIKLSLLTGTLLLIGTIAAGCRENDGIGVHAAEMYVPTDKTIIIWDLILNKEQNSFPEKHDYPEGLDILAPTWFALNNSKGSITNYSDTDYVTRAHKNGIGVWAVFENKSDDKITYGVLSNESKRLSAVTQLVNYAKYYRLDGINVDFEAISTETGPYFEKMVAELYERLKPLGITLSVDINAPSDIEGVYDLNKVVENSDLIVLMAYDQHYAGSQTAGPVAEIKWVKSLIEQTLKYTSPEKIILGIPFYTIIWSQGSDGLVHSETVGMKEAYERIEPISTMWKRLPESEQIYTEYRIRGKGYTAWLEDEHSISLKLDQINNYGLAGMSAWRRGLEWPNTWDMINSYFR